MTQIVHIHLSFCFNDIKEKGVCKKKSHKRYSIFAIETEP